MSEYLEIFTKPGEQQREVVLRGGPADGLVMWLSGVYLHRPVHRQGWPQPYMWHLDLDCDEHGRPILRCEVPDVYNWQFVLSPDTIKHSMIDLIDWVEHQVHEKMSHEVPGAVVHVRWEGTIGSVEPPVEIDPRSDLAGFVMICCKGVVIKESSAAEEGAGST